MRTRPSRTTSIAGAASSSMRQNHCSEISGSIRSPERWGNGALWGEGSRGAGPPPPRPPPPPPPRARRLAARLARFQRGHAREALARRLGHAAVLADGGDLLQPVGAADL